MNYPERDDLSRADEYWQRAVHAADRASRLKNVLVAAHYLDRAASTSQALASNVIPFPVRGAASGA